MKTVTLIAAVAASLFVAPMLHAQTTASRATITARNNTRINSRLRAIERNATATTTLQRSTRTDGVVPRAVRSGNPLQMINPLAPAEYGDGRDVARHEVDDPYQRPQGLKLFAVEF